MMDWRPEGWDIEKIKGGVSIFCNAEGKPSHPNYDTDLIEAGANAMLKAVRDRGCPNLVEFFVNEMGIKPIETIGTGKFVFIPDDRDET